MTAVPYIKKNELLVALILIFLPYLFLTKMGDSNLISKMIPMGISWFGVLLLGDLFNRKANNNSGLLSEKIFTKRVGIIALAAFIMNVFSDLTGSILTRLWYFPNTSPITYLTFFTPLGYLVFGLILFVFYHAFKGLMNKKVKAGRTKVKAQIKYQLIMNIYPFISLFLILVSVNYFYNLSQLFPIKHLALNQSSGIAVDLTSTFSIWLGIFFMLEFLCFKQKKETLTRDIIRHNFIPLIAIILSSLSVIILIEWFNAPFQVWVFDNWGSDQFNFLSIPAAAYLIWPIQYLVLLPLIRFFDNSNRENIW